MERFIVDLLGSGFAYIDSRRVDTLEEAYRIAAAWMGDPANASAVVYRQGIVAAGRRRWDHNDLVPGRPVRVTRFVRHRDGTVAEAAVA